MGVGEALGWGALAASSLVLGALIGLARPWPDRLVGLVLAFGAGALVSAVSFELAQDGVEIGGPGSVAIGMTLGSALTSEAAQRWPSEPSWTGYPSSSFWGSAWQPAVG